MATTTNRLLAAQIERPRPVLVGAVFGCAAALMLFLAVVATYVLERAKARSAGVEWFADGTVELGPSGFIFWTLVLSVFTMQWALQAVNAEDRFNAYVALGLTALFGAAIFNQLWFIINDTGFALAASTAQYLFFVVNGTFVVFLIAAVVFVVFTFVRALAGQFGPKRSEAVAAAALFWHTVVLMWAVVYFLVYITK